MRIAIIGAGMTAVCAATACQAAGAEVIVFDKGRGPGGRMSSKRWQSDGVAQNAFHQLDLGAQYFTARHPAFMSQVAQWLEQGLVQRWDFQPYVWQHGQLTLSADSESRYVGTPAMHQMIKAQLGTLPLYCNCRVTELSFSQSSVSSRQQGEWTISTAEGTSHAGFSAVLLTCPPEQSRQLLAQHEFAKTLPAQLLLPCWAFAFQLKRAPNHPAEGIFVKEGSLSWCSRNSAKPGRHGTPELWVAHLNPTISAAMLEATAEDVVAIATQEFSRVLGEAVAVESALCHRWLYASFNPLLQPPGILTDSALQLAVAGDWSLGGRVENAWLAGQEAARQLLANC